MGLGTRIRSGYKTPRMILTTLIRLYQSAPRCPQCLPSGPSCSELGLAVARAGGSVADVLTAIRSCRGAGPQIGAGPHIGEDEYSCGGCCNTGCYTTTSPWRWRSDGTGRAAALADAAWGL